MQKQYFHFFVRDPIGKKGTTFKQTLPKWIVFSPSPVAIHPDCWTIKAQMGKMKSISCSTNQPNST
jgi:hypothetical protein